MRIGRKTPAFDSIGMHCDVAYNYKDGTFIEVGSHSLNRWDTRLTLVLLSEYPRSFVSIAGRCLKHPKQQPDFLAIRCGAMPAKYFRLSIDSSLLIHIDGKGAIRSCRRTWNIEDFREEWKSVMQPLQYEFATIGRTRIAAVWTKWRGAITP